MDWNPLGSLGSLFGIPRAAWLRGWRLVQGSRGAHASAPGAESCVRECCRQVAKGFAVPSDSKKGMLGTLGIPVARRNQKLGPALDQILIPGGPTDSQVPRGGGPWKGVVEAPGPHVVQHR